MTSTRSFCKAGAVLLVTLMAACDQKPPAPDPSAAKPAATAAPTLPQPDVGKVEIVRTTADGYGATASEAVAQAIRMAVLQVNGAAIDMSTVNAKLGIDIATEDTVATMRAEGYSDVVRTRSGGVVQNFRMVNMDEPLLPKGRFKATIEAGISKFAPSADLKKIKIVVAPLRFDRATVPMGDRSVPAEQVGTELRQRILDALVNTGRFAVLDRDFSPEIQQELDMIAGGSAPSTELAKLSQAVSADVIWTGKVNGLAYNRHARQLRTSDRELVSYSGGWSLSQKMVNVATRQVMTSETLHGEAPSTAATTLGSGVDSTKILGGMTDDLVQQVVASILSRSFPITVVSLDGSNAILSQGGQALRPGARYAMVTLTKELTDPQTGQSLGRVETPCCQLVIDRVTPNLSYGHVEGATRSLDTLPPGTLQVREQLKGSAVAVGAGPDALPAEAARNQPKAAEARRPARGSADAPVATDKKVDEKW